MPPMVAMLLLLGASLFAVVFLVLRRGGTAAQRVGESAGVGYRWGALCGGLLLASAAFTVLALSARAAGPMNQAGFQLTLVWVAVSVAAGVGLAQRRRYGVVALMLLGVGSAALASTGPLSDSGGSAGFWIAFSLGNLLYFRKRWSVMSW